jgi:hypothetical protein
MAEMCFSVNILRRQIPAGDEGLQVEVRLAGGAGLLHFLP